MPWTGSSFHKHNRRLSNAQSEHAARIASAVLKTGAPEGESIAVANKYFQRRDVGGNVDPTSGGIGGIQPSTQTANPLVQGMVQRYASLPPERLQELSVMLGGSPQGQIIQRILQQKRTQPNAAPPPQQQAAPPSFSPATPPMRSGGMVRRDVGGNLSLGQADPYWARNAMSQETSGAGATGYLHGTTSGRADSILTNAPGGSYVIPADVVSGLGEGNSLAGANIMDHIIRSGPHGIPQAQPPRKELGAPRPPPAYRESKGGKVGEGGNEPVPVALSHGEYTIGPDDVMRWGGGDIKKGHRVFDHFVVEMRKHIIATMKKLPGPVGAKKAA